MLGRPTLGSSAKGSSRSRRSRRRPTHFLASTEHQPLNPDPNSHRRNLPSPGTLDYNSSSGESRAGSREGSAAGSKPGSRRGSLEPQQGTSSQQRNTTPGGGSASGSPKKGSSRRRGSRQDFLSPDISPGGSEPGMGSRGESRPSSLGSTEPEAMSGSADSGSLGSFPSPTVILAAIPPGGIDVLHSLSLGFPFAGGDVVALEDAGSRGSSREGGSSRRRPPPALASTNQHPRPQSPLFSGAGEKTL